ncbi:MAG: hypothetical protein ACYDAI_06830 [Trichloromonadaceae bacterium]
MHKRLPLKIERSEALGQAVGIVGKSPGLGKKNPPGREGLTDNIKFYVIFNVIQQPPQGQIP